MFPLNKTKPHTSLWSQYKIAFFEPSYAEPKKLSNGNYVEEKKRQKHVNENYKFSLESRVYSFDVL